ncbi:hypothetical protein SAMN02745121_06646 [Nannocystis exedens]|uniref:Uncharacterized protein n=1 Tax=Nannocystis exedens TaxID=54 RepID=A0A1I2FFL9_9BACT|nr:hypothetical protein [Nannocystis exedens]PCC70446.1 hypothetical protein NAEX_03489 [Nannocystis exedens]SFF04192.1 hypothetical protein SAMN02745121_06646 [Nannocystis exedens]
MHFKAWVAGWIGVSTALSLVVVAGTAGLIVYRDEEEEEQAGEAVEEDALAEVLEQVGLALAAAIPLGLALAHAIFAATLVPRTAPRGRGGRASDAAMTGLDARFLYMESPSVSMHAVVVMLVDVSSMRGGHSTRSSGTRWIRRSSSRRTRSKSGRRPVQSPPSGVDRGS